MSENKDNSDDTLTGIRISGRNGKQSKRLNGDFFLQTDTYNDMPYYKKKDADERLFYCTELSSWKACSEFTTFFATATSDTNDIEPASDWEVYEGKGKGMVLDPNIKIETLSISKALYESIGCNVFVEDILNKSNEDILIYKEAIKIQAYWKVVMKRFIDVILILVSDRLVEIPFEYETQNEIHEMVLSGDKDMLHLMSIDKDIVRKARLNRVQLEQITKAKQIMRTIR
eukprot:276901_1